MSTYVASARRRRSRPSARSTSSRFFADLTQSGSRRRDGAVGAAMFNAPLAQRRRNEGLDRVEMGAVIGKENAVARPRLQTKRQTQIGIAPVGAERHNAAAQFHPVMAGGALKSPRRKRRDFRMRPRHAGWHDMPGGGAFRAGHQDVVEIAELAAAVVAEALRWLGLHRNIWGLVLKKTKCELNSFCGVADMRQSIETLCTAVALTFMSVNAPNAQTDETDITVVSILRRAMELAGSNWARKVQVGTHIENVGQQRASRRITLNYSHASGQEEDARNRN